MNNDTCNGVHFSHPKIEISEEKEALRPELVLAVAHFSATGNDDRPVYIDNHPPIPHLKKREASSKVPSPTRKRNNGEADEHYFSWKLTYCMKALMQHQHINRADGWKLAAITVNLPFLRSIALTSQKKRPATAYGDAIADRLSHLHRQPRFFSHLRRL